MEKPVVTHEDFSRFLKEGFGDGEGPIMAIENWFEDHGLSEEVEQGLVRCGMDGMGPLLMFAMSDSGASTMEEKIDVIKSIAATMLISGFTLGWEACTQFGGGAGALQEP